MRLPASTPAGRKTPPVNRAPPMTAAAIEIDGIGVGNADRRHAGDRRQEHAAERRQQAGKHEGQDDQPVGGNAAEAGGADIGPRQKHLAAEQAVMDEHQAGRRDHEPDHHRPGQDAADPAFGDDAEARRNGAARAAAGIDEDDAGQHQRGRQRRQEGRDAQHDHQEAVGQPDKDAAAEGDGQRRQHVVHLAGEGGGQHHIGEPRRGTDREVEAAHHQDQRLAERDDAERRGLAGVVHRLEEGDAARRPEQDGDEDGEQRGRPQGRCGGAQLPERQGRGAHDAPSAALPRMKKTSAATKMRPFTIA